MNQLMSRADQRALLQTLTAAYPAWVRGKHLPGGSLDRSLIATIAYLAEQGLIDAKFMPVHGDDLPSVESAKINHRGIDFLADDGGLGAILNVQTIRLDADTIKHLVAAKIDSSALDEREKSTLRSALDSMTSEGGAELVRRLVGLAFENSGAAWTAIRTALTSA